MHRFKRAVVDVEGRIVPCLQVQVVHTESGGLASLYADRLGNESKANPFMTTVDAVADFHVEDGLYDVRVQDPKSGRLLVEWPELLLGFPDKEANSRRYPVVEADRGQLLLGRVVVIELEHARGTDAFDNAAVTGELGVVVGVPSADFVLVQLSGRVKLPGFVFTKGMIWLGVDGFPTSAYNDDPRVNRVQLGNSDGGDNFLLQPDMRALGSANT
jgi:hypothetical protein